MFILWISSTDPDLCRHSRPLASPSPTTILTLTSSFVRLTHQCRPRTRSVAKILTHHHNFVSFFLSFLQFFFFMRFMEKLYQFTRCGSLLSSNFMSLFDYFLFYLFSQNPFFTCSFTLFSSLCQICVLLSCKEICEEKYGYK